MIVNTYRLPTVFYLKNLGYVQENSFAWLIFTDKSLFD